jgi:hypothetical protein
MTEYADGNRLGALADKSRSTPLARLRIARDIAAGEVNEWRKAAIDKISCFCVTNVPIVPVLM